MPIIIKGKNAENLFHELGGSIDRHDSLPLEAISSLFFQQIITSMGTSLSYILCYVI